MEKNFRVFSKLETCLKDVRQKVSAISGMNVSMDCFQTKEKCRSYTTMKNILESLVVKSTEGKKSDDDVATDPSNQNLFPTNSLRFQNLISSDEYLAEVRKLSNPLPNLHALLNSLAIFQELLGDILHSVCQISSCQTSLPSGILVKDVLGVSNQYSAISDLVSSMLKKEKPNTEVSGCTVDREKSKIQIIALQTSLQSCIKEMSKVKLHIEHYCKLNVIEIQSSESDFETKIVNSKSEETVGNSQPNQQSTPKKQKVEEIKSSKPNYDSFSKWAQSNNKGFEPPDTLFPDTMYRLNSYENNFNMFSFPPRFGNSCGERNMPEKPCGDFFSEQVVYPTDFLFLDPRAMYIQSQVNTQKNNLLPRIYSVDSVTHENSNSKTSNKENNLSDQLQSSTERFSNVRADMRTCPTEEKKFGKHISLSDVVEEDLFTEDDDLFSSSETQSLQNSISLQKKISSLFDILKSNQEHPYIEDIFQANPLKIELSDFSSSQQCIGATNSFQTGKFKTFTSVNPTNLQHSFSKNLDYDLQHFNSKDSSNKNAKVKRDKPKSDIHKKTLIPKHQAATENNLKTGQRMSEGVIYNTKSLIELFHASDDNRSIAGSSLEEENSFCMWPVTAEYVHVSKEHKPYSCQSVSSNGSIPLTKFKSFEKSYFSLHMKKRYEQKQVYDGDILMLENSKQFLQQEKSSQSLLNQPYTPFIDGIKNLDMKKSEEFAFKESYAVMESKEESDMKAVVIKQPNSKNKRGVKKSIAVCYENHTVPFNMHNQHLKEDNFDFLKINRYGRHNNWNSFISVFTSNLVPPTQINHHRMFRKVINTFETESMTCNILGNLHTLTSNGGPFRLFDVNGYPLTDSSGNVLKDPYGKSVVILDSTGLPRDDTKVFDAAGNSPKDIKFDPTQKPKSNSLIIKLTDNFKRPLRLFDKYDRPLTDSFGKLLVNIHGRPLLRFDNFGRPNTDYRGGPLYTDNGQRWSYKNSELFSNNQNSTETIPGSVNLPMITGKKSEEKLSEKLFSINKDADKYIADCEKNGTANLQAEKLSFLDSSSEIWTRVETVLQQFPRKKPTDSKSSQTSVIINSVTVAQNQNHLEKDFLKSIIYHNSFVHQDNSHDTSHFRPMNDCNKFFSYQRTRNDFLDEKPTPDRENYGPQCLGNKYFLEDDQSPFYKNQNTAPFALAFNNNFPLNQRICSMCLLCNKPHTQRSQLPVKETINEEIHYNFTKSCLPNRGDSGMRNTSRLPIKETMNEENYYNFDKQLLPNQGDSRLKNTFMSPSQNNLRDEKCKLEKPLVAKDDGNNSLFRSTRTTDGSCRNSYPLSSVINNTSYFTFKHHDYLNNLCNTILKQQISYQDKIRSSVRQELITTSNQLTNSSICPFTSSKESKYTTDIMTRTESPSNFSDTCRKISQEIKSLQSYDNDHQIQHSYTSEKEKRDSSCGDCYKDRQKPYSGKEKLCNNTKEQSKTKQKTENTQSSSEETAVTINVLNQEDKHFEVKVTEMPSRNVKPKFGLNLFSSRKNTDCKTNLYSKQLLAMARGSSAQNDCLKGSCLEMETKDKQYCGKNMREHAKDSPFRFPSDDKIYSTLAENHCYEDKKCKSDSNISRENEEFGNPTNKTQKYHRKNHLEQDCCKPRTHTSNKEELNRTNKNQGLKSKNSGRKDESGTATNKKSSSANRECNFVSFLGSPVKYVLNKLDSKRISKPNNEIHEHGKKKIRDASELNRKSHQQNVKEKNTNLNSVKVKTLYDITQSSKRNFISSNEKAEINNNMTKKYKVTAFQSKSCTDLANEDIIAKMTYSGKNNQRSPTSDTTKLHKCFSRASYSTPETHEVFKRTNSKYGESKQKAKVQQYSFKSSAYRKKSTHPDKSTENSSKDTKQRFSGNQLRSPSLSNRTKNKPAKGKEVCLYKKVEPEGKYMLKIKK